MRPGQGKIQMRFQTPFLRPLTSHIFILRQPKRFLVTPSKILWMADEQGNGDRAESTVAKAVKSLMDKKQRPQSLSEEIAKPKISLYLRMKEGLLHYWHGTKLLAYETKISSKLLFKVLRGHKLIRREHRQLLRTTSDLLRLVPFMVILIIPFLEFALPVILKLFPNMLPSTFEDKTAFVHSLSFRL